MQAKEKDRYQVVYLEGENEAHPHVVDTKNGGKRIVRFGETKCRNSLFHEPEGAKKAAQLLNSGATPKEINIHKL